MIEVRSLEIPSSSEKKPVLWVTWLSKECLMYARNKLLREPQTAIVTAYDSSNHNHAQFKVKKRLEQAGYNFELEKLITVEYESFSIGAFVDVLASHQETKKKVVVEIKPRDRACYENQVIYLMVLLADLEIDTKFFMFEHLTSRWISKIIDDVAVARNSLLHRGSRVLSGESIVPVSSKACWFCPYAHCEKHPKHGEYLNIPDFIEVEEESSALKSFPD